MRNKCESTLKRHVKIVNKNSKSQTETAVTPLKILQHKTDWSLVNEFSLEMEWARAHNKILPELELSLKQPSLKAPVPNNVE